VSGLKEKLTAAANFGATTVFVPATQMDEAREFAKNLAERPLEIGALGMGDTNSTLALAAFRRRLQAEPPPGAPFDELSEFYLCQERNEMRTRDFYGQRILPPLIEHYRTLVSNKWEGWRPKHLVACVSAGSFELLPLTVGAIRPANLWLVHTTDFDKERRALETSLLTVLANEPPRIRVLREEGFTDMSELLRELPAEIDRKLGPEGSRVFDVTLGTVAMSLTLTTIRRASDDDRVVYWYHEMARGDRIAGGGRVRPGSQRLLEFDLAGGWDLATLDDPSWKAVIGGSSLA
jgi:hypothetical protein